MAKRTAAKLKNVGPAPQSKQDKPGVGKLSALKGINTTAFGEPDYVEYFKRHTAVNDPNHFRDFEIAVREVLIRMLDLEVEHGNTVWPLGEFIRNVAFSAVLNNLAVTPENIQDDLDQYRNWFEDLKNSHKVYEGVYIEGERRVAARIAAHEQEKKTPHIVKPAAKKPRKAA